MKTIVGFLSRPHGFNVLKELIKSREYSVIRIYTHSLNPKSQDSTRSKREDYSLFENLCSENQISLIPIDSKNQEINDVPICDFIVEVSWRYLIKEEVTKKPKIASFGIHRGKLPEYAGAEPIKQALSNNEKEIILSAHFLDPQIDAGGTISTMSHPVNYDNNSSLEENIQRLRDEITPLFSKLTFQTLKKLENNNQNKYA